MGDLFGFQKFFEGGWSFFHFKGNSIWGDLPKGVVLKTSICLKKLNSMLIHCVDLV